MLCERYGRHTQGPKHAPQELQLLCANCVGSACGFAAAAVGWVACSLVSGACLRQRQAPKRGSLGALVKKKGENFELFAIFAAWAQNFTKSRFFSAQECPARPGTTLVLPVPSKPPYMAAMWPIQGQCVWSPPTRTAGAMVLSFGQKLTYGCLNMYTIAQRENMPFHCSV